MSEPRTTFKLWMFRSEKSCSFCLEVSRLFCFSYLQFVKFNFFIVGSLVWAALVSQSSCVQTECCTCNVHSAGARNNFQYRSKLHHLIVISIWIAHFLLTAQTCTSNCYVCNTMPCCCRQDFCFQSALSFVREPSCYHTTVPVVCTECSASDASEHHSGTRMMMLITIKQWNSDYLLFKVITWTCYMHVAVQLSLHAQQGQLQKYVIAPRSLQWIYISKDNGVTWHPWWTACRTAELYVYRFYLCSFTKETHLVYSQK